MTEYYVAPFSVEEPTEEAWERLAEGIADVSDDSDEATEDIAWYSGDGTPVTDVVSYSEAYSVEGQRILDDPAQTIIVNMKRKTGDGRKIWFRKKEVDGTVIQGVSTVTDPVIDGGPAEEHAPFTCRIGFNGIAQAIEPSPEV